MRRLLPDVRDETPAGVYDDLVLAGPVGGRSGVSLGMVSSVDGGATVDGRTADLGGEADQAAFGALRAASDAILVGAGTVLAEDYGPAAGSTARRRRRLEKGLAASPRLVIVSNRLGMDPAARVFGDPDRPPLLVTSRQGASARPEVAARGEVLICGEQRVDLGEALRGLAARGLGRVLCEGGPGLNASLFARDLVDELFLTLAPTLVGGDAPRIIAPLAEHTPRPLELLGLREHAGELLLHYRIRRPPADRL
ncbi:MAG TPA: dihydrofolate reductase family protein [Egicoccus sp.]|nr:dihydrofolate reductase family protein [Egicoccus sp.]HSK24320.1 dihydrofolate reductase family protein [Egicoccus sp.]